MCPPWRLYCLNLNADRGHSSALTLLTGIQLIRVFKRPILPLLHQICRLLIPCTDRINRSLKLSSEKKTPTWHRDYFFSCKTSDEDKEWKRLWVAVAGNDSDGWLHWIDTQSADISEWQLFRSRRYTDTILSLCHKCLIACDSVPGQTGILNHDNKTKKGTYECENSYSEYIWCVQFGFQVVQGQVENTRMTFQLKSPDRVQSSSHTAWRWDEGGQFCCCRKGAVYESSDLCSVVKST